MQKVREAGVDVMTFGQYMRPTRRHMPVSHYVTPEAFDQWKKVGEEMVRPCTALCHFCTSICFWIIIACSLIGWSVFDFNQHLSWEGAKSKRT